MTSCITDKIEPAAVCRGNERRACSASEAKEKSELNGIVAMQYQKSKDSRPCQSKSWVWVAIMSKAKGQNCSSRIKCMRLRQPMTRCR